MSEQDKENELKGSILNGDAARSAGNPTANSSAEDIDLANDPILGGSSINSEDYWFLKLNNMQ